MKWLSELSPDTQAKIVVGVTVAQILVNVFIFVGIAVVIFRVLV